ncbi:Rrf2 family transcriptional regulator [Massilia arenosa]|uniref:Rrf2 family transcriptional regulator n=1 Tax=Zemynaea arenosa TaxID=2561931 RepID=A0A4Y9SHY0_9BURK|nr:Rrf2 family transcriptional regulator [Massilia arenosa]TFW25017.1 Rrf2 family transcriptional regulator [Massilia arenosa]
MKRDSKLSSVLHVLLHMADAGRPLTSDELAGYLDTNPVVVRRTLAGMRERGYVASEKGHGGGWTIACDLAAVTLRDVYEAVGAPSVLALDHRSENPACLVEQAVNAALDEAFREAEALLVARLGEVTLADLARDFTRRFKHHKQHHHTHGRRHEH